MTIHLIASVGLGRYREMVYRHGTDEYRTRFAPVAVGRLAASSGGRASILVTPQAREKWFKALSGELALAGFKVEAVDIPECRNEDEILETFFALSKCVHDGEKVVLDVTYSLRHLPFVYLAALAYLVGLKHVEIKGIYYGAQMLGVDDVVPLLDVSPLFDLMEWYQALKSANDTGDFRSVAVLLRRDAGLRFMRKEGDVVLGKAATAAETLAVALSSGLPLEVGHAARYLMERVVDLDTQQSGTIAPILALGKLRQVVEPWAFPGEKKDLVLDRKELLRQLLLAEWYLERGSIPTALLILREWLVNMVLLARGQTEDWLNYGNTRRHIEIYLNAVRERGRAGFADEPTRRLASLWDRVTIRRNEYAHAGMKPGATSTDRQFVDNLLVECREILDIGAEAVPSLTHESGGCVLVSPLGLSPGALFSAVSHVQPDRVLVITSDEAARFVPGALAAAGRPGLATDIVKLYDPHQGFNEAGRIFSDDEKRRWSLVSASQVVINITGGTTAMQYAVEDLGRRLRRYGALVRKVALVDRRDIAEQRRNPYVLGELVELDGYDNTGAPDSE